MHVDFINLFFLAVWGCFGGCLEVCMGVVCTDFMMFWRGLGGNNGLRKLTNKHINTHILIVYAVCRFTCLFGWVSKTNALQTRFRWLRLYESH